MYKASTIAGRSTFSRIPLNKLLPVVVIAIVGLSISIGGMLLIDGSVLTKRQVEFDKAINSVVSRLEQGASAYENVLYNLDGLFRNSVQVVRDVFELYSAVPAESNPAIISIGYANFVRADELGTYTFYARSERYYDYAIHPSGFRPEYVPVLYIVPYPAQQSMVGFDILGVPELARTVQHARQMQGMVASKVISLRQDTQSILLMMPTAHKEATREVLLPTAHSRFDGVLFVEINFNSFLSHSLGDSVASDRNIEFRIIDDTDRFATKVLAGFPLAASDGAWGNGLFRARRQFTLGDQTFSIDFVNASSMTSGIDTYFGLFALIGGIAITLILCGFVITVLSSRERAIALADRITEGNRRILEASQDIIGTLTLDGRWQSVNPAVRTLLGYEPDQVIGKLATELIATEPERIAFLRALSSRDNGTQQVVVRMNVADGSVRWVSWNISIDSGEYLAYSVGRDVTIERQAQKELELRSQQIQLAEQLALEANASKKGFIRRLTRYLRTSLTTTLASMHEMVMTMEPANERQRLFVKLANESSDRLFAIVNDLIDVAQDHSSDDIRDLPLVTILKQAEHRYSTYGGVCTFILRSIEGAAQINVEESIIVDALSYLYCALSEGLHQGYIELTSMINNQEHVMELQILVSYSPLVAQIIMLYNRYQQNPIDTLVYDQHQTLFRLNMAASQIRRMGGTLSVETLGEEGNVALLTLPLT